MSAVDAAIAAGIADPENLFVTGGSGGGVLTSLADRQERPLPRRGHPEAGHQLDQHGAHRRRRPLLRPLLDEEDAVGGSAGLLGALAA